MANTPCQQLEEKAYFTMSPMSDNSARVNSGAHDQVFSQLREREGGGINLPLWPYYPGMAELSFLLQSDPECRDGQRAYGMILGRFACILHVSQAPARWVHNSRASFLWGLPGSEMPVLVQWRRPCLVLWAAASLGISCQGTRRAKQACSHLPHYLQDLAFAPSLQWNLDVSWSATQRRLERFLLKVKPSPKVWGDSEVFRLRRDVSRLCHHG